MSVVNRMLQDIDRRRAAVVADTVANAAGGTTAGTSAVAATHRSRPGIGGGASSVLTKKWRGVSPWAMFVVIAALAGCVTWWMQRPRSLTTVSAVATVATPTPVGPMGATIESTNPVSEQKPTPTPLPSERAAAARDGGRLPAERLKLSMQLSALGADTPTDAAASSYPRVATVASSSTTAAPPATAAIAVPPTSTSSPPAPPVPVVPGKTTITAVPVRQVAFEETINIARSLWSEGSRASALTTLRDAMAAAESTRNQRATAALAKEVARLDVADNRAQSALELLKRLENLLGEDADAWSLRGNAEQRLALHADAVQSYLIALRIRPTEGKWMIGAAISLAAVGKLDEAQSWAERARERDAVTPAIASYLQQLGITSRR